MDPGKLQEGGHAVAKTAYDKPVQRRGIMNLNNFELTLVQLFNNLMMVMLAKCNFTAKYVHLGRFMFFHPFATEF